MKTFLVSPIRGLIPLAQKAQQKGIFVHHLNMGNPNLIAPEAIRKALHTVADTITRIPYPESRGQQSLLESWKRYFTDIHIPVDIVNEDMIVTAGAGEGIFLTAISLFDEDDEFILFEPFYPPYLTSGPLTGAKPVAIELDKENNYHLPAKEVIVKKITPKTKAIFLTNPNNPTGTVFTRKEIEMLLEIAEEYNLFLISDEAYRGLVFEKKENFSILHIATISQLQHVIVLDSLSKRLNVCGARIGLIYSKNQDFITKVLRFVENHPQVAYIEQEIVAPMLSDSLNYLQWLTKGYEKKRNIFLQTFEKELGEKFATPEGAFYSMLQLPIDNDMKFAKWLLTDFSEDGETVMVAPGSGFYVNPKKGEKEVRIAYILSEEELERAARLLAHGVQKYG